VPPLEKYRNEARMRDVQACCEGEREAEQSVACGIWCVRGCLVRQRRAGLALQVESGPLVPRGALDASAAARLHVAGLWIHLSVP
jgi:ribosomal protein L37AE/L43A